MGDVFFLQACYSKGLDPAKCSLYFYPDLKLSFYNLSVCPDSATYSEILSVAEDENSEEGFVLETIERTVPSVPIVVNGIVQEGAIA